jgi:cell division protein FtsI (penicillin-binding protein 3)
LQLGRERFERYIQAFGFGQKTGLELPGEAVGIVRPAKKWPLIQLATVSFGQGISVTAMQLAQAYAVVANGGVLLQPHLVERVQSPDGTQRVLPRPAAVRVVSPPTAAALGAMLEGVVSDKGTGAKAEIPGVRVAGKTATAQKVDPALGGYAPDKFVANFAGYVPAEDPRFVIVVVVDEPSKAFHFGGLSAAPIFQKIATGALRQAGLLPATQTEVATVPQPAAEDEPEEVAEVAPGVVPDVRGLMLGEAFDVLKRAGVSLEPDVQGSGRIVSQEPAPGGKMRDGKLHLILASARGGRDAAH